MKLASALAAILAAATPAFAHTGHVSEAGGHSHWIAITAFFGVAVIALTFWRRRAAPAR